MIKSEQANAKGTTALVPTQPRTTALYNSPTYCETIKAWETHAEKYKLSTEQINEVIGLVQDYIEIADAHDHKKYLNEIDPNQYYTVDTWELHILKPIHDIYEQARHKHNNKLDKKDKDPKAIRQNPIPYERRNLGKIGLKPLQVYSQFAPENSLQFFTDNKTGGDYINTYEHYNRPQPIDIKNITPYELQTGEQVYSVFLKITKAITNNSPQYQAVLIDFIKHCIENPGHKLAWFPVIYSKAEDIGKTLLANLIRACIGKNYTTVLNQATLMEKHNDYAEKSLFLDCSDITISNSTAHRETLNMLTAHEIPLRKMGKGVQTIRNRFNLIVSSNNRQPVPIKPHNTRFMYIATMQTKNANIIYESVGLTMEERDEITEPKGKALWDEYIPYIIFKLQQRSYTTLWKKYDLANKRFPTAEQAPRLWTHYNDVYNAGIGENDISDLLYNEITGDTIKYVNPYYVVQGTLLKICGEIRGKSPYPEINTKNISDVLADNGYMEYNNKPARITKIIGDARIYRVKLPKPFKTAYDTLLNNNDKAKQGFLKSFMIAIYDVVISKNPQTQGQAETIFNKYQADILQGICDKHHIATPEIPTADIDDLDDPDTIPPKGKNQQGAFIQ